MNLFRGLIIIAKRETGLPRSTELTVLCARFVERLVANRLKSPAAIGKVIEFNRTENKPRRGGKKGTGLL